MPPSPTGSASVASSASDPAGAPVDAGMTRPVIGLTTYLEQATTGVWDVRAAFLPEVYFSAITAAGGIAVLLPPQPADSAVVSRVLDGLDGLVITGGKDVDPARYGQSRHPATDEPRADRDAWEDALITAAIDRELPFLGICRGAQLLNVALGGTLHQHLPDVLGTTRYHLGGGVFADNEVTAEKDTLVEAMVGGSIAVKSYHHQAIDAVAAGLTVSARSDDGTIQAVEVESVPFGVAVQWHPEQDDDPRLFQGLVAAAREYGVHASGASRG